MLVTIIVPIYNIKKEYLNRCIESICNQTYDKIEIVLVDDGSTDGSAAVIDNWAAKDSRIVALHKANGGSSSARNAGLDIARGEYIGFIDSDDYIDADFVKLMVNAATSNLVDMVQISRDEIDENGNRLPDVCIPPAQMTNITAMDQMIELLMHRGDCSFCTRLTHRKLFENRRFPVGRLNEDFYLLMQMLAGVGEDCFKNENCACDMTVDSAKNQEDINLYNRVEHYVILPNQAYHVFYRMDSNSRRSDREDFSRVFMDIVDNADWVEKVIVAKYPELQPYAKRFALYQRLDYLLHIPISMMTKDNEFYMDVWQYLRDNKKEINTNTLLTSKNKMYLTLLSVNPGIIRKLHSIKMKLKKQV